MEELMLTASELKLGDRVILPLTNGYDTATVVEISAATVTLHRPYIVAGGPAHGLASEKITGLIGVESIDVFRLNGYFRYRVYRSPYPIK